jgi:hypothetical protein
LTVIVAEGVTGLGEVSPLFDPQEEKMRGQQRAEARNETGR